jgi:hypothetical protein
VLCVLLLGRIFAGACIKGTLDKSLLEQLTAGRR